MAAKQHRFTIQMAVGRKGTVSPVSCRVTDWAYRQAHKRFAVDLLGQCVVGVRIHIEGDALDRCISASGLRAASLRQSGSCRSSQVRITMSRSYSML